jgi:protein phosphatase
MWPHAYLVHVGDSRCYRLRDGRLELLTLDQTMAQALYEAARLKRGGRAHLAAPPRPRERARRRRGDAPRRADRLRVGRRGAALHRRPDAHVTDDEIADHLRAQASAEETCRSLVALALERGGRDNITVVNGRLRARHTA